jgi:hypothetical protein
MQRKADIPSRTFLQDKRSRYRRIAKLVHPEVLFWLDGTRTLPELHAEIQQILQSHHPGGIIQ